MRERKFLAPSVIHAAALYHDPRRGSEDGGPATLGSYGEVMGRDSSPHPDERGGAELSHINVSTQQLDDEDRMSDSPTAVPDTPVSLSYHGLMQLRDDLFVISF